MAESRKIMAIIAEVKAKALANPEFRKKFITDPKKVLHEAGAQVPKDWEVKVVESTANLHYIALPFIASGKLSDEALAAISAGGSMTGICPLRSYFKK